MQPFHFRRAHVVRVPIALADRVLAIARQLDSGESPDTVDLPDAADLLNRLKGKRKRSKADLGDVEMILELLAGADSQQG